MLSRHAATAPSTPGSPMSVPHPTTQRLGMYGTQTPQYHAYGPLSVGAEDDLPSPCAPLGATLNIKPPVHPGSAHISSSSDSYRSFAQTRAVHHQRQQSVPNFPSSSFDNNSNSSIPQVTVSPSLERGSGRPLSANMPFTGDGKSGGRSSDARRGGVLSSRAPKDTSPSTSRFAFFSSPFSKNTQPQVDPTQDEELLSLDIQNALFPPSSPTSRDAFSPAAFKNLEATAIGLLKRFQSAYQRQDAALQELRTEKDAQAEEHDEADTRIQHLRVQLENMASKVAEQEQSMQQLMAELNAEKKARHEERITRERNRPLSEGSTTSEDLGVDEDMARRKWRKSAGFDTDDESVEDASVFSRSRSPTTAAPSVFEGSIADMSPTPQTPKANSLGPPRPSRSSVQKPSPQQVSVFQKLMRGVAGDTANQEGGPTSCANCRGQDQRAAWDTVSLLRDENHGLKHRVEELETCVDNALDAVNGLGLY